MTTWQTVNFSTAPSAILTNIWKPVIIRKRDTSDHKNLILDNLSDGGEWKCRQKLGGVCECKKRVVLMDCCDVGNGQAGLKGRGWLPNLTKKRKKEKLRQEGPGRMTCYPNIYQVSCCGTGMLAPLTCAHIIPHSGQQWQACQDTALATVVQTCKTLVDWRLIQPVSLPLD